MLGLCLLIRKTRRRKNSYTSLVGSIIEMEASSGVLRVKHKKISDTDAQFSS